MVDVVFDNIIFTLQRAGGISSVWKELIDKSRQNEFFRCQFIDYVNGRENLSRQELRIEENAILNPIAKSSRIERYSNPSVYKNNTFVFHSSYYRTCSNKYARNITTVHDFVYEFYRTGLPKTIHHLQKRNAVLNSKAIICVSNNTKNDLLNFFPQVKEENVHVIYNGVSEIFSPIENPVRPDFINALGDYVLYVGIRTDPHKNFMNLVQALHRHSTMKLVLVGGGPLIKAEVDLYNKYLQGRYIQFSNVTNLQLNELYNYAFALIYPSIYEGFGIPILESQRAGCPVIATNKSCISEVAGDSAILTDSGSIEEIDFGIEKLKNTSFRMDMIQKGLVNSHRFSWGKMASEVLDLYENTLR